MFNNPASEDVWCITMDQFWLDFIGAESWKGRPVSFVEAFPLTLWLHQTTPPMQNVKRSPRVESFCLQNGEPSRKSRGGSLEQMERRKLMKQYYSLDEENFNQLLKKNNSAGQSPAPSKDLYCLAHVTSKVYAQMTHYQFLMTLRLIDSLKSLLDKVDDDTKTLIQTTGKNSFMMFTVVPSVEFAMLCCALPGAISQSSSSVLDNLHALSNQSSEDKTMTNGDEDLPTLTTEDLAEGKESIISRCVFFVMNGFAIFINIILKENISQLCHLVFVS